jgi:uncharacterized protein YjbJ (UPF0337 family)
MRSATPAKGAVVDKDRVEGKLKEMEGQLTDDESREAEGRVQGTFGEKKDDARGAWEKLKDRVGEAINRRHRDEARSR